MPLDNDYLILLKVEGRFSATWRKRLCDVSSLFIPWLLGAHALEFLRRQANAGEREDAAGLVVDLNVVANEGVEVEQTHGPLARSAS